MYTRSQIPEVQNLLGHLHAGAGDAGEILTTVGLISDGDDGGWVREWEATAERVDAILLWSALPGASRHHWGTDVDLIDARAIEPGYRVRLTRDEFAAGGPFARLAAWLDQHAPRFGFFRPYRGVRSGVQPEPWHFSFAPTAEKARRQLTAGVLREAIASAPLLGKELILPRIEELHARYVASVEIP